MGSNAWNSNLVDILLWVIFVYSFSLQKLNWGKNFILTLLCYLGNRSFHRRIMWPVSTPSVILLKAFFISPPTGLFLLEIMHRYWHPPDSTYKTCGSRKCHYPPEKVYWYAQPSPLEISILLHTILQKILLLQPPPSSWNFHWPSVGGGGGALWIPELHNNSVNIIMIWQKLTVSSLGFCSITLIMGNMSLLMQNLKKLRHEVITIRLTPDMPPLVTQDFTVLGVVIKQKLTRIKGMCCKEQGSLTYGFSNILRVIREIWSGWLQCWSSWLFHQNQRICGI